MKNYSKWIAAAAVALTVAISCVKEPTEVKPEKSGERGASCQAKNDCASGLSCINDICQEPNFGVEATGKECFLVDCQETADCCGDRPTEPPAKCRAYDDICSPSVPGCLNGNSCLDDDDCSGGTCSGSTRFCDLTGEICTSDLNCTQDVCEFPIGLGGQVQGTCSLSNLGCFDDGDCYGPNSCGAGTCNCSNPNYDPTDELCSDEDCTDVCTLVCNEERCVEDNSCEDDDECLEPGRDMCDDGACVECIEDEDCDDELDDEDDEDRCLQGSCRRPCQGDAECGFFQACNADSGECEFVGCRSDNECIFSEIDAGVGDQRLTRCVPDEDGIGQCVIECDIDIHCGPSEACEDGECVYIGCTEDTDCKTILGLHNWEVTDLTPWVPTGACREVGVEDGAGDSDDAE